MNRRILPTLGMLVLCLAIGVWPGMAPVSLAKPAPRMVLGETSHDFGQVSEGTPLTYTFPIQNKGKAPLKIVDVDPDCACTVPSYDQTIPPGGQGQITLTIKPFSLVKQFRKRTRVFTNDPQKPEVVLVLSGMIQPLIEIQPNNLVRFVGDPREEKQGQVRFISHLPTPLEIIEWRTNIPEKIEVNLKVEEPGRVYVLEVKNRMREGGRYNGLVEIFTNSKERPRLIVRVFATFYPPSANP